MKRTTEAAARVVKKEKPDGAPLESVEDCTCKQTRSCKRYLKKMEFPSHFFSLAALKKVFSDTVQEFFAKGHCHCIRKDSYNPALFTVDRFDVTVSSSDVKYDVMGRYDHKAVCIIARANVDSTPQATVPYIVYDDTTDSLLGMTDVIIDFLEKIVVCIVSVHTDAKTTTPGTIQRYVPLEPGSDFETTPGTIQRDVPLEPGCDLDLADGLIISAVINPSADIAKIMPNIAHTVPSATLLNQWIVQSVTKSPIQIRVSDYCFHYSAAHGTVFKLTFVDLTLVDKHVQIASSFYAPVNSPDDEDANSIEVALFTGFVDVFRVMWRMSHIVKSK